MITSIHAIIINLFFIIFPLVIYQLFFLRVKNSRRKQYFLFFSCVLVMILCMSFPISATNGHYLFDLRQVPLIIGFLYGGPKTGVLIYLLLILYRVIIGGSGTVGAIVDNTLLLCILFAFHKFFYRAPSHRNKQVLIIILSFANFCITILLFLLIVSNNHSLTFFIDEVKMFLTQTLALWLCVYFLEMVKKNQLIQERIHQSEKAEMVSQLAASISHEVRNPLTVSRGFLQLMKEGSIPDERKEEFFDLAIQEIDRATSIITDYLTFAKPALEKEEEINLAKELAYCVEMIKPLANMQSIDVKDCITHTGMISGEKQKLHQTFINVLKNAVEAMPKGGMITIRTIRQNGSISVQISDTGVGMTADQVKRLGEPYFSTKEKGTGLGMMVVYSLAEAMRGTISVSSKVGKGTDFMISFPLIEEEEPIETL